MSEPDLDGEAPASAAPFIRRFSTPAGAPWDQTRAARLEAVHGAPLPAALLEIVLRRVGRWRPGAPAVFAAAYFRRDGIGEEQRFIEAIDGLDIEFLARGDGARRRAERLRIVDLSLAIGAVVGLLLAGGLALARRSDLDSRLRQADMTTQRALQAGHEARRRQADARALDAAGGQGALLTSALDDLVWLSRARRPEAVVEQFDWTPGEMRVTARGPQSPIATADRPVSPSDETRPGGMRVWRIQPMAAAPAQWPPS
jgi:hypothetical protein